MYQKRVVLVALLLLFAATSNAASGGHDLTLCLDVATTLEAGGDVGDKDLIAAHQACQRAEQTPTERTIKSKLDAASVTIDEESARRQASRRPH